MKRYNNINVDNINLDNKDFLLNKIYSDELQQKINNYFNSKQEKPFYIGVIGCWGSGKTTIVNTAISNLKYQTKIFKYDAWKYEDDSFRRTFIKCILEQSKMNKMSDDYKKIDNSLYEDSSISTNSLLERINLSRIKDKHYKSIISWIAVIALVIVVIASGFFVMEQYDSILGMLFSLLGSIGFFNILYAETTYNKSKLFSPEQFYSTFKEIIIKTKGRKNIVFIDNLDRCEGDNLILTLKSIKGFYWEEKDNQHLKKEKVVFIIPLDINSLNEAYHNENSQYYIDKIFDDTIYVKPNNNTDKIDFINSVLGENLEIDKLIPMTSRNILAKSSAKTPREIVRIINMFITEYNLICSKNGDSFFSNSKNLDYLMKSVIISKKYPELIEIAYNDMGKYKHIESLFFDKQEEFVKIHGEDCLHFLKITKHIKPSNYHDFYLKQKGKDYNLPENVVNAIFANDIEKIKESTETSAEIKKYFIKSVYYDVDNLLWNINILNKFNCFIQLVQTNYFNKNEIDEIIKSWNEMLFNNQDFYSNVIYNGDMNFDDLIYFINEIPIAQNFKDMVLNGIINNSFNYEEITYETNINKFFANVDYEKFDEKTVEFINKHIKKIITGNLYKQIDCSQILNNKIILSISSENISGLLNKLTYDDSDLFGQVLAGLYAYKYPYNENILNTIINSFNRGYIHNLNSIMHIYEYLYMYKDEPNCKNFVEHINLNVQFEEIECFDFINLFIKCYVEHNIYNSSFTGFLNKLKLKENVIGIFNYFSMYTSNNKNNYVQYFLRYLNLKTNQELTDYINYIVDFYINNNSSHDEIIILLLKKKMLRLFYSKLKTPDEKVEFVQNTIKHLTDKDDKFNNIFIYESDDEIFKQFMEGFNNITDTVEIIPLCNKDTCKEISFERFINILEGKENIVNSEFHSILSLLKNNDININKRKYIIKIIASKISAENLQQLVKENIIKDNRVNKIVDDAISIAQRK